MTRIRARTWQLLASAALGMVYARTTAAGDAGDGAVADGAVSGSASAAVSVPASSVRASIPAASPAMPSSAAAPAAAPTGAVTPATGSPALGAPSAAVYPPSTLPLTFDHARHVARGVSCTHCHTEAKRSLTASDNLLPGEGPCRTCHQIDRTRPLQAVSPGTPPARCDACHQNYTGVAAVGMPTPEPPRVMRQTAALKFNHKLHVDRQMACTLCHAGLERVALATTAQLPKMQLCLGCHDGRQAPSRCVTCHVTLADGRLRTTFPSGTLVPSGTLRGIDAHTAGFRTDHKVAGRDERYCATCHKQSECLDCHGAGVVRQPDFHPVDYATLHAVDARRNIPNCSSCHRNQSFCLGCHQRLGVAADPEGGQPGQVPNNPFGTGTAVKRFHPPGWVRDEAGTVVTTPTSASHSFQAKRNLRTCVSCHREESCLSCHSADPTRSMRISPHRPGFAGSSACRALAARNLRACLKCHPAGAGVLSCD